MAERLASVIALTLLLAAAAVPEAHGQTPPAQHATLPAVSPDGRHVAFISARDGQTDLYVIDAEGRDTTRLTSTAAEESRPSWSADGREILVSRMAGGWATLYAIAWPSATERVLHRVEGRNPMPLGAARILFATGDWKAMQLASAALDGSDVTRVSDGAGAIWNAAVSPDAGRIAFSRQEAGALQVFTMNATGQDVRPIGPFEGRAQMPAWAPDGRRLAVQVNTKPGGTSEARIWVIDLASGSRQELGSATPPHLDEVPSWFPDGRHIAFQSDRSGRLEIWAIDVADGTVRQITR